VKSGRGQNLLEFKQAAREWTVQSYLPGDDTSNTGIPYAHASLTPSITLISSAVFVGITSITNTHTTLSQDVCR